MVKLENNSIGILGGSFNPIHKGHEAMIWEILNNTPIQQIILLPSFIPPHKNLSEIISFKHRLAMLSLMFKKWHFKKKIIISILEKKMIPPSYTYHTLQYFKQQGLTNFYFIMGEDSANSIDTWYESINLKNEFKFIILRRNDSEKKRNVDNFFYIDNPYWDISSSKIRNACKNKNLSFLKKWLNVEVFNYIQYHNLYSK